MTKRCRHETIRITPRALTVALAIGGLVAGESIARAAAGSLDKTFGTSGTVATQIGSNSFIGALALQPDGKVIAVGSTADGDAFRFALARYDASGNLDPTFGTGGEVVTAIGETAGGSRVVLQPDGKIVMAGWSGQLPDIRTSQTTLVRYNADGSIDPTFGAGGVMTTPVNGNMWTSTLLLQPDGKLMAVGGTNQGDGIALARFNGDGTLDPAFGTGGTVSGPYGGARAAALQSDGKVVAAIAAYTDNSYFGLMRYNPDGSLDSGFGASGVVIAESLVGTPTAIAIQADGGLVVTGYVSNPTGTQIEFALARFLPDGSLDPAFGTNGSVITPVGGNDYVYPLALVIQADDKIVVTGGLTTATDDESFFVRYNPDGTADRTFGRAGTIIARSFLELAALILQPDGKLVAGGVGFTLTSSPSGGAQRTTPRAAKVRSFALARYVATSNGLLSPGGGALSRDCTQEWSIQPVPQLPDRGGFPVSRVECTDDDPRCDFGASADDQACTFHVALCFNVAEQRFACTPSNIETVQLTKPNEASARDAVDVANRDAIESALATLGGSVGGSCLNPGPQLGQLCALPADCDSAAGAGDGLCEGRFVAYAPPLSGANSCTAFVDIKVPLRSGTSRNAKSIRTRATPSNDPATGKKRPSDIDRLTLICDPHP